MKSIEGPLSPPSVDLASVGGPGMAASIAMLPVSSSDLRLAVTPMLEDDICIPMPSAEGLTSKGTVSSSFCRAVKSPFHASGESRDAELHPPDYAIGHWRGRAVDKIQIVRGNSSSPVPVVDLNVNLTSLLRRSDDSVTLSEEDACEFADVRRIVFCHFLHLARPSVLLAFHLSGSHRHFFSSNTLL